MSEIQDSSDQEHGVPTGAGRPRIRLRRQFFAFVVAGCFLFCACAVTTVRAGAWIAGSFAVNGPASSNGGRAVLAGWPANSAELTVAVSPSMAGTLSERAERFNRSRRRTPDGALMQVELVTRTSREMVQESLQQPGFQAVAPDSSLWLGLIDLRWAQLFPTEPGSLPASRVGQSTLFAVSPVVVATQLDAAQKLGWPQQSVGWKEVHARAAAPSGDFSWGHPGPDDTSGVAAALSKFYAGADVTRGLTTEIATQPDVIEYVRRAESDAYVFGAGGRAGAGLLQAEGRERTDIGDRSELLDAFVTQEQTVIAWNRSNDDGLPWLANAGEAGQILPDGQLVAIYPKEGTFWADHPLALLELDGRAGPAVTQNQRRAYRAFTEFLLSEESQVALLEAGFRPVDVTIDLMVEPSPFVETGAVNPLLPQTLLPLPPQPVLEMVLDVWRLTKRPANILLVVDTSESMEGGKLVRTKAALHGFVGQIQGDRDRVGLVEFGSGVKRYGALQRMDDEGRSHLHRQIENMEASGSTNLIDAVWAAHSELNDLVESEANYVLVVLTDGRDNDSEHRLRDLERAMQGAQNPVTIYTVAFGRDADVRLLEDLARIGGGQFYRADETTIEELYRLIATYIQKTG